MLANPSHWWRRPTRTARRTPSAQPRLEVLEDRISPAVLVAIQVRSNADDGSYFTLRAAVNRAGSGDTIDIINLGKPIVLTHGEILINKSITIQTLPGLQNHQIISGGGNSRIFEIAPGANVTLQKLDLTNGNGVANPSFGSSFDGKGGAILNEGTLLTSNCTLSGNSAFREGGALFNASAAEGGGTGSLSASGGADHLLPPIVLAPAALAKPQISAQLGASAAVATLNNTILSGNHLTYSYEQRGGAIFNAFRATMTITGGSTVGGSTPASGNSAGGSFAYGGAIFNQGMLTITASTVSNNSAAGPYFGLGGAIFNQGTLTVTGSTLSRNSAAGTYESLGGAIMNAGRLTVTGSILSGNSATTTGYAFGAYYGSSFGYGGAIFNQGLLTVTGSTLSLNSAYGLYDGGSGTGGHGGGIANFATATVSSSTVNGKNSANTDGGGIWNSTNAALTINLRSKVTGNISPQGTDLEDLSLAALISLDSTVTLINN